MGWTYVAMYLPAITAIIFLVVKWPGMKHYLPVGLFAALFANLVCHVAMLFNLWSYPFTIEEAIVNCICVPILSMFWIRYRPRGFIKLIRWNLLWSIPLTGLEYLGERFTRVIEYRNGYDWYYSLILWIISWFVWYGFYFWYNQEK